MDLPDSLRASPGDGTRTAKGRKQYRYHAAFREARESAKFAHMMEFARVLPTIRNKVDAHMGLRGLPREKILATVVHLLETTLIRIGNDDYATRNRSFGLTTLRNRHARVTGAEVRFQFRGKSGKLWSLAVKNRSVAKIIRSCQELPGQQLLQYVGDDGEVHSINSSDVNEISSRYFRRQHFSEGLSHLGRHPARGFDARRMRTCVERERSETQH